MPLLLYFKLIIYYYLLLLLLLQLPLFLLSLCIVISILDWHIHYAALSEYYKDYGHCNVPFKAIYECVLVEAGDSGADIHYKGKLGRWVDRQRQNKKGSNITTTNTLQYNISEY